MCIIQDTKLTEKLSVNIEKMGDWIIDFPYTRRTKKLFTRDAMINLMEKQIQSLNDDGLEVMAMVVKSEQQKRMNPRPLSRHYIGDNDAA